MNEAYIFDAIRSPRGKNKNGSLTEITPVDLTSKLLIELQSRNQLETSYVNDVILGCVTPIGDQGGNIAKTSVEFANWSSKVPGVQLNRYCASGLDSINQAAMRIRSGWEDLIVAGGIECMSRVKMGSDGGAKYYETKVNTSTQFVPQGIGADLIATIEGFTREDLDNFALLSQIRANKATKNNFFKSLIPIKDQNGMIILDHDEHIRPNIKYSDLSELSPSFQMQGEFGFDGVALQNYINVEKINHLHTPGNSSGIVDGGALTLIGSKKIGKKLDLKPRAKFIAAALVGTDPIIMLLGPGPASKKALKLAKMRVDDIDLIEINEAFASVVLRFMRDMGLNDLDRINVNGGSIAMGHPLGATGAMLLGTALDELERRDKNTALITLCVGGGMGIATIIERTDGF
jgi:acetyl-CoA C-acetyltransferase